MDQEVYSLPVVDTLVMSAEEKTFIYTTCIARMHEFTSLRHFLVRPGLCIIAIGVGYCIYSSGVKFKIQERFIVIIQTQEFTTKHKFPLLHTKRQKINHKKHEIKTSKIKTVKRCHYQCTAPL